MFLILYKYLITGINGFHPCLVILIACFQAQEKLHFKIILEENIFNREDNTLSIGHCSFIFHFFFTLQQTCIHSAFVIPEIWGMLSTI